MNQSVTDSSYEWLEQVEGSDALRFIEKESQLTRSHFSQFKFFKKIKPQIQSILESDEKPLSGYFFNSYFYQFTRTKQNPRGFIQRCLSDELHNSNWQTVIDFSKLSLEWDYQRLYFSEYSLNEILVYLSYQGKDTHIIRRFSLSSLEWDDSFEVPLSKSNLSVIGLNQYLVVFGVTTTSGYPREVFYFDSQMGFESRKKIFEVPSDFLGCYPVHFKSNDDNLTILQVHKSFYESEFYILNNSLEPQKIEAPFNSELVGFLDGSLYFKTLTENSDFKKDSIYKFNVKTQEYKKLPAFSSQVFIQMATVTEQGLFVQALKDVRLIVLKYENGDWVQIPLESESSLGIFGYDKVQKSLFLTSNSFIRPSQFFKLQSDLILKPIKSDSHFFESDGLQVKQEWCVSKDGTRVPYFVIGNNLAQEAPTILNAYGGFYWSRTPFYMPIAGKVWLENGGTYVVGNIRGGAEFGSDWHDQVIKENRPKCFQDMAAIAEDLVEKGYTTQKQLGISGGSNGGLLVSGTMVHYPEVCSAVFCAVPLIDMERYHFLHAGKSWSAEYGTVEDSPAMQKAIQDYNPFRQVQKGANYPQALFFTSTFDDRVHPGHARRMYAKMKDMGHKVWYLEEMAGGHQSNVPPEINANNLAIEFTFFAETLGLKVL